MNSEPAFEPGSEPTPGPGPDDAGEPFASRHHADRPVRAGIPDHGRVPRYYTVKVQLFDLLTELGEGTMLPSERDLAERFGVSRLTIRQAVGELVLEGLLVRRQGSGTFVSPPKFVQSLALVSYTESLRDQGAQPGRSAISVEHVLADEQLAAELAVAPGALVIHLERVLTADGERVGLESTYLSHDRFPDLLGNFDATASLYAYLGERLGVVLTRATERWETVLATPREALLIGTSPALPMLLLHRVSYDQDDRPIERVRALYRGDRFSFVTTLYADQGR
ncbi:MAG TPA: GntR family transcriptional regulator [Pseudonocardiaceae bacterium]|jgi:GntR family transcriptional regulator|nr:GntR family transcriptional regulator [Pseudonocardiaceae bacterium]